MKAKFTLADLLAIEADPELWDPVCPVSGVPYWHLVRNHMLRMITSDEFYSAGMGAAPPAPKTQMVKTALRSVASNLFAPPRRADVLVMATGVGVIKDGERWMNRLADHFVSADPNGTALVEDQFRWQWRSPRAVSPYLYHMPLQARCVLQARMGSRKAYRHAADHVVTAAMRRAAETVGFVLDEQRALALKNRLTSRASELPHFYRAYQALLKRLGTKIVLKEEASYGSSAALMAAANSLGVVTAEYQHGLLSSGHTAYNFATEIHALPALRRCLPRFLLTYGDWWNEQVSAPIACVTIGNPHRSHVLAKRHTSMARSDNVLFLGDGLDTGASLTMARAIAAALPPSLRLVFRPHPIERDLLGQLARTNQAGVEVDDVADINASMFGTAAVVGEVSTGLFESVGLAGRTFVWDTPKARFSLGSHPFETFSSATEFATKLAQSEGSAITASLWASGWQHRYAAFLSEHGVANPGE